MQRVAAYVTAERSVMLPCDKRTLTSQRKKIGFLVRHQALVQFPVLSLQAPWCARLILLQDQRSQRKALSTVCPPRWWPHCRVLLRHGTNAHVCSSALTGEQIDTSACALHCCRLVSGSEPPVRCPHLGLCQLSATLYQHREQQLLQQKSLKDQSSRTLQRCVHIRSCSQPLRTGIFTQP